MQVLAGTRVIVEQTRTLAVSGRGTPLSFTVGVSTDTGGNWLSVSPTSGNTGTTVANLTVSITPVALALPAAIYTGRIVVTAGGSAVTVPVTLQTGFNGCAFEDGGCVPSALNITAVAGAAATRHQIQIELGTDEFFDLRFTVTYLNGSNWITVPGSQTLRPGINIIPVTINYSALPGPGVYQARITGEVPQTGESGWIPVTVTLLPPGPTLRLSQHAFVFATAQGGAAPPPHRLTIGNAGSGSFTWTLPANPAPWLSISPASGAAGTQTTLTVNPAGLASGVYQVEAPVTVSGAANSPQSGTVTLLVAPSSTPAQGLLSAYGMVFVATQGGAAPPSQQLTISNIGGGTVNFNLTPSTTSGNWLAVSPASGSTASGPATAQVSVTPVGLTAGIHRGKIFARFPPSTTPQEVDVVLVVSPPAAAVHACMPQSLDILGTTIGSGQTLAISFPRVIHALTIDSCGTAVSDATVVAGLPSGSIPLLPLGNGLYTGTWTPQQPSGTASVQLTATHASFSAAAQRTYMVSTATAAGGFQLPVLGEDGVVEGAGFTPRRPLAPGGIISLFGTNLAGTTASAPQVPLPTELGGVSVRIGGRAVPLYFVSPGQINAQVPFEAGGSSAASILVTSSGRLTAPQNYVIAPAQPAIFRTSPTVAAILDSQFRLVTPQNPATLGDTLQIFATGLGLTDPPVQSGEPFRGLTAVQVPVTVSIGGVEAAVVYQGGAPDFVGLYQINAVVPNSVTPGDTVTLVIRQNGVPSNQDAPVTIPVRDR